ncbi:MAG: hypothetical protein KDD36_04880 [Flavobacteriales bacterium]|nr:hypothetical protein [Flavobacteriales bacterium]
MINRRTKILIPGDFERTFFTPAQTYYIRSIAGACHAHIRLIHLSSTHDYFQGDNPYAFLRSYQSTHSAVERNTQRLSAQLKKQGLEVDYVITGYGNQMKELLDQIILFSPDFVILRKKRGLAPDHHKLLSKIPVLCIPESPPQCLPSRLALLETDTEPADMKKLDFFFRLTRNLTGSLVILDRKHKPGMQINGDRVMHANNINRQYGINIETVTRFNHTGPRKNNANHQMDEADLPFVLWKNKSTVTRLLGDQGLRKLLRTTEKPFFIYSPETRSGK